MNALTALPTRRDETWRYADMDAVKTLGLDALNNWREIAVEASGSQREMILLTGDIAQIMRLRVNVGDGARAEIFAVNAGNASCRLEIEVTLGRGAHFEFGGVTIGGSNAANPVTREFVTQTIHALPDATSNQTVRSVHWDNAIGNFLGEIKVARHAQKTDAAQDFKALLLEKGASANAVPQLEIFADDVKCAHGATVGELDEAARFYMAARGLSPDAAKRLLVQAFIGDALVALDDEAQREAMMDTALAALGGADL